MDYISVEGISKRYGDSVALHDVSFEAARGSIVALLGPSGCGKTTLLNLIAGFIAPDAGRIQVGGRDLTAVPTRRRNMGMVFQSYALFPHLSVARNVAFGLEARGVKPAERRRRVTDALELVRLSGMATRLPHELSGGQQQRVSIARAAAVQPDVLLLDEPLSNLDTLLRQEMREELRAILKRAGTTAILVTHDQEEALAVADLLVLLHAGRVAQIGNPAEVFERPANPFCARFLAATNLLEGVVEPCGDRSAVRTGAGLLLAECGGLPAGAPATLVIRPERISVPDGETTPEMTVVDGTLVAATYLGTMRQVRVQAGTAELVAQVPVSVVLPEPGGPVRLAWPPSASHVLPGWATAP